MPNIKIILPKMGESVMEATITQWLKKPGDFIAKDEIFVTIGTDKVESDLPSEYDGTLKEILVPEGNEILVGKAIAILEVSESVAAKQEEINNLNNTTDKLNTNKKEEKVMLLKEKQLNGKTLLSPIVRKIAAENGLELTDLQQIKGSGENGRIRKKDILSFLQPNRLAGTTESKLNLSIEPNDVVKPLPRIRKVAAEMLQHSYQIIPHVTTFAEADVTEMVKHREAIKNDFSQKNKTKITYTHYIMHAVIACLKEFTTFNAWFNNHEIILKNNINLGFATALANGNLIVPNVKNVNDLSLIDLVKNVNTIAQNAKNGKLTTEDIQNTTFTISNTGIFGSMMGTPIISQPQVAVLALGNIHAGAGVVVKNGIAELAVRKKMMLSISYDHRVIDGALASQFLTRIIENLAKDYK